MYLFVLLIEINGIFSSQFRLHGLRINLGVIIELQGWFTSCLPAPVCNHPVFPSVTCRFLCSLYCKIYTLMYTGLPGAVHGAEAQTGRCPWC